jgi:hypothetical protein
VTDFLVNLVRRGAGLSPALAPRTVAATDPSVFVSVEDPAADRLDAVAEGGVEYIEKVGGGAEKHSPGTPPNPPAVKAAIISHVQRSPAPTVSTSLPIPQSPATVQSLSPPVFPKPSPDQVSYPPGVPGEQVEGSENVSVRVQPTKSGFSPQLVLNPSEIRGEMQSQASVFPMETPVRVVPRPLKFWEAGEHHSGLEKAEAVPAGGPETPRIQVRIGRVEVRITQSSTLPTSRIKLSRPGPRLTLEDYLKQRTEGRR